MYSDFLAMVNTGSVHSARIDDAVSHVYFRTRVPTSDAPGTAVRQGSQSAPGMPLMLVEEDLHLQSPFGSLSSCSTSFRKTVYTCGSQPLYQQGALSASLSWNGHLERTCIIQLYSDKEDGMHILSLSASFHCLRTGLPLPSQCLLVPFFNHVAVPWPVGHGPLPSAALGARLSMTSMQRHVLRLPPCQFSSLQTRFRSC